MLSWSVGTMRKNNRDVNSARAVDITLAAEAAILLALTTCPALMS